MRIEDVLDTLEKLDELDKNITQSRDCIQAKEKEQEGVENSRKKWEQALHDVKARHLEITGEIAEYEESNRKFQEHIEKLNIFLNTVRTNKEYKDVLGDIEKEKNKIKENENYILTKMEEEEELREEIEREKKVFQDKKERSDKEEETIKSMIKEAEAEIEGDEKKKEPLFEELKTVSMRCAHEYERLSQRYGGGVIAHVEDEICQACNMEIRAHMLDTIKLGKDIVFCEYCYRFLTI